MNGQTSSSIALATGVLLMLAAPLAVWLIPAQTDWTDEDQQLLQTASADYHAALHPHHHGAHGSLSHDGAHASHPDPEDARLVYERQQARLDAVQARGPWLVWGLRLTGVALAGLGLWGYLRSRQ